MADEREHELAGLAAEVNAMRAQGTEAQRQYATLQTVLGEIDEAHAAISALKESPSSALLSLGAGAFAPAQAAAGKILVDVGAGVLAEKAPDDALALLDEKRARVQEAASRLEGVLAQVQARLNELGERAAELQRA